MATIELQAERPPGALRQNILKLGLALALLAGAVWMLEGGRVGDTPAESTAVNMTGGTGVTPRIGEPAPAFKLQTPDGAPFALADLRGRPVVVNFWATWCPPCRGEMPDLEALAREHRASGLVVVGINLQEDSATVQRYAETLGLSLQLVLDREGQVANAYNLTALPTTYFVDRAGVVRDLNIGALTAKGLKTKVEKVLQ